jgi:hypothetical protein
MANVKITDLTAYTDPLNTDVLAIVDVTNNVTKKVSIANMAKNVSLGTAALPGVAFDGDPNTGIYSPGADQLAVATNGTGRLFIDSAGLVGVNQASPSSALDVNGEIRIYPASGDVNLRFGSGGVEKGRIAVNSSSNCIIETAGTERLRITSAGLVGIGTSSPGAKLDVSGDAIFNGGGTQFPIQFANAFTPNVQRADIFFSANATSNNALRVGTIASNGGVTLQGTRQSDSSQKVNLVLNPDGGSVGIGTTSPGYLLHLTGSTPSVAVQDSGANGTRALVEATNSAVYFGSTYSTSNVPTIFSQAGASGGIERMRIDTSGRLLVGTSTSTDYYGGTAKSYITDQGGANLPLALETFRNDEAGAYLILGHSRSGTAGNYTILQPDDGLGLISFHGSDGTDLVSVGATIKAEVDGTPGANDMPGRIVLATTADGAASPTEAVRINSSGNLLVGVTSSAQDCRTHIYKTVASGDVARIQNASGNTGVAYVGFRYGTGTGTETGYISTNGTSTTYNTTSDYRLKENVTPITNGITRFQQLKPSKFNFIADPGNTVEGFLAHEAQAVVPECVTGEKDALDDEGNPKYQGIDQSKLVPLLTAALQEAIARIETLETRLTALEGA